MENLLYDRVTLQKTLDKTKRPYKYLKDTFFSTTVEHLTDRFAFDVVKGTEQIAPFVHPEIGGKMLEKAGYETKDFQPPEVSPEKIITAQDVESRLAGEEINSRVSKEQRQLTLASRFIRELDEAITRREELMCSELLFYGRVTVEGEGYPRQIIDFWPSDPAEQPFVDIGASDADLYWDGASANIIDDLVHAADRIEDNSNTSARIAILGAGAAAALRADEDLWKKLDNRRINVGSLETRRLDGGVRYLGTFLDSGLELYTYRGSYIDPVTKQRTKLVPDDRVLIGSPSSENVMNYGRVTLTDEQNEIIRFIARDRVADSWMQRKRPAGRILQIKSRPLPTIRDIDSFYVMKVLAG